ncbi:MAG: hypothetical protein C4293_16730 [Nitrospiraceae bacterium]
MRSPHHQSPQLRFLSVWVVAFIVLLGTSVARSQTGIDFPGTVQNVDPATKKLSVKKDEGGTRFTFVVNEKTQFSEPLKSLNDIKKGDGVTVTYTVIGSQYLAQKIASKTK